MTNDKALGIKQEISSGFLFSKTKVYAMSFAAGMDKKKGGGGKPVAHTLSAPDIKSSINGVGVSEKANGEKYVKVLTRDKTHVTPKILSAHFGVKAQDIIIEHTGIIRFKMNTGRHRPIYPGISVGHYQITAGTIGCFVKDGKGRQYILSNNHVLANTDKGYYGDPILQPGKLDGGKKPKDIIAQLSYVVKLSTTDPNEMDAAIAEISKGINPDFRIDGKKSVNGLIDHANHMKVEKFGRTTGHTVGSVTTRNLDLQVDYDGELLDFQDQFEIKGVMSKGKRTMFCDGGDSGSLILQKGSFKAVGLLFSGNDDGTTFATPIRTVLDAFSVNIL
ncbi:MAG TPA: hypothetical protein VGH64_17595 [Puia sp.]